MPLRTLGNDLQKALCKILLNPTVEVVAALVVVAVASWVVVQTDVDHRAHAFPVPFGLR